MNRYGYERLKIISLEEGFAYISSDVIYADIDGHRVRVNGSRLRSFLKNGTKCAYRDCSLEGSFFAVERNGKNILYHLNLWGTDSDTGEEVLFTQDHIIAKSLGGSNKPENIQTMCGWHNWKKGSMEGSLAHKQVAKLIQMPFAAEALRDQFEGKILCFKYTTANGKSQTMGSTGTVRKTFNFYLNDPGTWDTMEFVRLVRKHAGCLCTEVKLVNNQYINPILKLRAHRYDLYFIIGQQIATNQQINEVMQNIETEMRQTLNITMVDSHFAELQAQIKIAGVIS